MNGFYLAALIIAFVLVVLLAGVGKGLLSQWSTPVSNAAPATIAQPLVPTPAGGVRTINTPDVVARPVVVPGTGQPVAVMPVPANPAPLTDGNAPNPNNAPRGDERPPAPRSY